MRTSIRFLMIAAALAGAPVAPAQCPTMGSMPSTTRSVSKLDLRAKEDSVKAGSPLWVEATMTNISDHAVSFWKSTKGGHVLEISDDGGTLLADKRPGYRHGRFDPTLLDPKHIDPKLIDSGEIVSMLSGSLACVTLRPGETLVDRIEVTKVYDLSKAGSYTIVVEGRDPESGAILRSNGLKIVVTK